MDTRAILLIIQLLLLGYQIYTLITGKGHGISPFLYATIICFVAFMLLNWGE